MIEKCTSERQVKKAIAFLLGNGAMKTSPYMYLNLSCFGVGNKDVMSWMLKSEDSKVLAIYLKYYDCLHVFMPYGGEEERAALQVLVESINPRTVMITGCSESASFGYFEDGWSIDHNYIIDMDGIGTRPREYASVLADDSDMEKIADLMVSDSHYSDVYDRDVLIRQMRDRFQRGYSRYYVIRDGNAIAAACSTYGEYNGLSMIGGVIVDPSYRRRGYASDVEGHICESLEKDGMSRVGFVSTANLQSLALHEKLGAVKIGTIHKFIRTMM